MEVKVQKLKVYKVNTGQALCACPVFVLIFNFIKFLDFRLIHLFCGLLYKNACKRIYTV